MVELILYTNTILLTKIIDFGFKLYYSEKVVKMSLKNENLLEPEVDDRIFKFMKEQFKNKWHLKDLIPIINIFWQIISIFNYLEYNPVDEVAIIYRDEFEKLKQPEKKTYIYMDDGLKKEYFVRFMKNGKYNTIWFDIENRKLNIIRSNGTVAFLNKEDQLKLLQFYLLEIKKGNICNLGYSEALNSLRECEEVSNKDMEKERIRVRK